MTIKTHSSWKSACPLIKTMKRTWPTTPLIDHALQHCIEGECTYNIRWLCVCRSFVARSAGLSVKPLLLLYHSGSQINPYYEAVSRRVNFPSVGRCFFIHTINQCSYDAMRCIQGWTKQLPTPQKTQLM